MTDMLVSPVLTCAPSSKAPPQPSVPVNLPEQHPRARLRHHPFRASAPLEQSSSPVSSVTSALSSASVDCSTQLSSPTPPSSSLSSTSTSSNSSTAATAGGLFLKPDNTSVQHEHAISLIPTLAPAIAADTLSHNPKHVPSSPTSSTSPCTPLPPPPTPPTPPPSHSPSSLPPRPSPSINFTGVGNATNIKAALNGSNTSTVAANNDGNNGVSVGPRLSQLVITGGKRRDTAGRSPLYHTDSDVSVGAAITTGLLHALRGAPSQERNAVFSRVNCDGAMLATFSGVGKHGLRLAELAASIIFRVVRRRLGLLNISAVNGLPHQRRNGTVGSTPVANDSSGNGAEVTGLGVEGPARKRSVVGQEQQRFTCDHEFRMPNRTDRYRSRDKDRVRGRGRTLVFGGGGVNNGGGSGGGGGLSGCGGGGLFGFSRAVSFHRDVKNRNCCLPGIVNDALNAAYRAIEATPWGRASSVSSTIALLRRGRLVVGARGIPTVLLVARRGSRTSVELVSGRPMEDADACYSYASAHLPAQNTDADATNLDVTVNPAMSSNENANVPTPACSTPSPPPVSCSALPQNRASTPNHALPARNLNLNLNSNGIRAGEDGRHWQKDVDIDVDDCNSSNHNSRNHSIALNSNIMSVRNSPQIIQGRFSLPYTSRTSLPPPLHPSSSAGVDTSVLDDGGMRPGLQQSVVGYCDTVTVRCFEVCRYHSHVIVSTSRLWNGECTAAPQRIVDVFARAPSDACVIDLSEAVMCAAFGNSLPTHDTTILCARLR